MFRKVMLFVTSFAIIGVGYVIYQWRDDAPILINPPAKETPSLALRDHASQPASDAKLFEFQQAKIPPGESGRVRVFDNKGNVKIAFQWTRWQPVSDTRFHLTNPSARMLLPGGQLAYIWSDEGEIETQKVENNNFNPRRGWLKGHVRVFVDRSKPEWREANADRIEPEQHPEMMVKMWMEDVDFDMDVGRLDSKGTVLIQSAAGSLSGTGLQLMWNEATRQIKLLRILHGDRAQIRRSNVMDFGLNGEKEATSAPAGEAGTIVAVKDETTAKNAAKAKAKQDRHNAAQPTSRPKTLHEEQLQFRGLEESEDDLRRPKENRIDTYRIEFHEGVVAEQKELARAAGRLTASLLQLTCDIGREEREEIQHAPDTQPAGEKAQKAAASAPADIANSQDATSNVEVHWTGELVAIPEGTRLPEEEKSTAVKADAAPAPKAEKVHLLATGSPVEVFDRESGHATCRELKYFTENRNVWLTGTAEDPARILSGDGRQLTGEKVFFDRQIGIARVQGPGRMLDVKRRKENDKEKDPCLAELAKELAQDDAQEMEGADITWTKSVQVEFGMSAPVVAKATDKPERGDAAKRAKAGAQASAQPKVGPAAYLKHAVFEGQVRIKQNGDIIDGDRVEAFFAAPKPGDASAADRPAMLDRLVVEGQVRMQRGTQAAQGLANLQVVKGTEDITCDRLEVEMTTDDTGRNVPKIGRAFGHPVARRTVGRATRMIRARDHLEIYMLSQPRKVLPEEQERLEAAARRCGYTKASPEWQAMQARLERRRRVVTNQVKADGDVIVEMRDPSDPTRNVDLDAEKVDCSLQDDEEITKALIIGKDDHPASVDLGEIFAKGPQISLDMSTQSMEIPGAGRMRFMSKQDLAGRPVDRPVPVLVDWTGSMKMDGNKNQSDFKGNIHAVSAGTLLDCREMKITFENQIETTTQPAGESLAQRWIFKTTLGRHSVDKDKEVSPSAKLSKQLHKKPSELLADGDAVIVSTEYAKLAQPDSGLMKLLLSHLLPQSNQQAAALPPPALRGPMVSRFRVMGPKITIRFTQEDFGVSGAGNLLVEDMKMPSAKAAAVAAGPSARAALGGLDSSGPSETFFQWKNSMSFLNKNNAATFDGNVEMNHLSGDRMVKAAQMRAGMNPKQLAGIKSRQANLTCDNLFVTFMRDAAKKKEADTPLSGITQLQMFLATGNFAPVLLEMDDGHQSATGTQMRYTESTGELIVGGSTQTPAQVMKVDEKTGQLKTVTAGPRESIIWNQRTRTLDMKGGTIRGEGK